MNPTTSLLQRLPLEGLSPSRLWSHLDPEIRALAARALYAHDWGDTPARSEADLAIARALRFREAAVRKLAVEKRAEYVARAVRPDDSLATSLLLALHLEHRRPLLSALLDSLGVPHEDGLIQEADDLSPPAAAALAPAVAALFERFPAAEVETYLATLIALDPQVWAALPRVLADRRQTPASP